MSVLFWKQTEDQVKERVEREMKFREKTMNSLLEKIDKENELVECTKRIPRTGACNGREFAQNIVANPTRSNTVRNTCQKLSQSTARFINTWTE
jgi:hypothetical protein